MKVGKPTPFLNTRANEGQGAFSPSGRWLAYSSNESGRIEVYVRPFPGPGGKWQVSGDGGSYPTWSRNSRELFYLSTNGRLTVVSYTEEGGLFKADKPRQLCDTQLPGHLTQGFRSFDLHPDGTRFAVLQPFGDPARSRREHLVLVLNFLDELRRLAPAK